MLLRDLCRRADAVAQVADFTGADIQVAVERGGLWIPAASIQTARLRVGLSTGRLAVVMADNQLRKLLWARSEATYAPMKAALQKWLGDRLLLE